MNSVRDGRIDVAVVAGPRITAWPSVGVRALSTFCTEMGLSVSLFGGQDLVGRGVIPLPGGGAIVHIEDAQHRVHRILARAVVRVTSPLRLPDPFPGWRSQGLLPLQTARRLREESRVSWNPSTVILGTGNPALRFGSELLEQGRSSDVYCLEVRPGSRVAAWEVERRRFEILGGRILFAQPLELRRKSALIWELRVQDKLGVQIIDAARIVAAGPFDQQEGFREFPPHSLLFELEQAASMAREEDILGWVTEEAQGRMVGVRISKVLSRVTGEARNKLERLHRRNKVELKKRPGEEGQFQLDFQGKWVTSEKMTEIRSFIGVPKVVQQQKMVASLECFENIECNECEKACPEGAIEIHRKVPKVVQSTQKDRSKFLIEDRCTACGVCLEACPSSAALMIHEKDEAQSKLAILWRGKKNFSNGELATLVNRQGQALGSARISDVQPGEEGAIIELDVPSHFVWEARGIREKKTNDVEDDSYLVGLYDSTRDEPIEINLDGQRRLVRENLALSLALFEIGHARPEDVLLCPDGSCGQCRVQVDGKKQLGCQITTRPGMVVLLKNDKAREEEIREGITTGDLCPCLGVSCDSVVDRLEGGGVRSPEAILSITRVADGKCRGQYCLGAFRRLIQKHGIEASEWIDWRFPWSEWEV